MQEAPQVTLRKTPPHPFPYAVRTPARPAPRHLQRDHLGPPPTVSDRRKRLTGAQSRANGRADGGRGGATTVCMTSARGAPIRADWVPKVERTAGTAAPGGGRGGRRGRRGRRGRGE